MAQTWWALNQHDRVTSWRLIRQMRAKPPRDPADALVYSSSLMQAQELFDAAALSSVASRALTLFYGLSQAGRAIAVLMEPGARLNGHGLTTELGPLRADPGTHFSEMTVRSQGKGSSSFVKLSALLGSAEARSPQNLGHLLGMIYETHIHVPKFPSVASRGVV